MESTLLFLGLGLAAATLASMLWSIAFRERRIWPTKRYTAITPSELPNGAIVNCFRGLAL